MGYTLKIGQLETTIQNEGLESEIRHDVKDEEFSEAPAYGEPTDNSNSRWPSYTSWHNAMRFVGLEDLMFNKETGLIREHPACFPLTAEHKKIIDKAHKEFYEKYPKCTPGYSPKLDDSKGIYEDPDWPNENDMAVRLEWLKYWVDWALSNCHTPVFYNS